MADRKNDGSAEEIQASGESIIIADAIYGGLAEIAGAIRELAKAMTAEEFGEPQEPENYLDGSRK